MHDFIAIKIILNDVDSCYKALDLIRSLYPEKENTYRDYIGSPKVNGYQSIHDSFFGKNGLLFQVQIRTVDMDRRNKYGIAGLWDKYKGKAGNKMLEELMNATPFFKLIETLGKLCQTDEEFYQHLVSEILCDIISVHYDGKIMRIPANISIVDFAYRLSPDFGNQMVVARVNDRRAEYSTILHDGDSVDIGISTFAPGPEMGWLKSATTIQAQTEIRKRLSLGRG